MASTQRVTSTAEPDFRPTPRDVAAMAEVLEGKHGSLAAEIADFFAIYHGEKGDAGRAWAWSGVAELVRSREQARLESN
jgi:hypothetical protein